MKIKITLTLPVDNEIQFADTCMGAAEKLRELAEHTMQAGDHEQWRGTTHQVISVSDYADVVGTITITK